LDGTQRGSTPVVWREVCHVIRLCAEERRDGAQGSEARVKEWGERWGGDPSAIHD
jgi:hypothetical protein